MEQLIAEVGRGGGTAPAVQAENIRCAVRVIGILGESADMPPSGPATLMVELGFAGRAASREAALPAELAPHSLASRCLNAMRVDRSSVPDLIRRERHYLVDRLGQGDVSDTESDEFDRLDEVRSLVRALRRLRDDISDRELAARVDEWMVLEPHLSG